MTAPAPNDIAADRERAGPPFWIALAVGTAIMAFGIRGALMDLRTSSGDVGRWVVGADLVHDLILAPIAVTIGWCVNRTAPIRARAPIQAGLFATAITLLIGWPGWRGYGRHLVPDNLSVQPLDYVVSILTVLAIVWGVVVVWIAVRMVRPRREDASGIRSRH